MALNNFDYVSIESSYRRVNGEEGPYDAHIGWQLHAAVRDTSGDLCHYLHPFVFATEDKAEAFQKIVEARGTMEAEHWDHINTDYADRDYEGEEMMLADRERRGLPL